MRRFLSRNRILSVPVAVALGGCQGGTVVNAGIPNDGSTGPHIGPDGGVVTTGHAVGEACSSADPCRAGLACTNDQCEFGHTVASGGGCVASGECKDGLQCVALQCAPAGTGVEGDGCISDTDCEQGLRCGFVGLGLSCVKEGTADVGQSCTTSADCYAGLFCQQSTADGGTGGTCRGVPPGLPSALGVPVPPKLVCDDVADGRVTAHFQVPGAEGTDPKADFFRLPFPTDARVKNGKIDFTGFPTPGSSFLGFDPVQIYLDAITANDRAWGAYPTTIFRFSGPINFDSFSAPKGSTESRVVYLDITDPQSPENKGATWYYSGGGGKYVCHDWFAVNHPLGNPLVSGHTYTVYLTTAGLDTNGKPIQRSPQFVAMLGNTAPADPALADAYAAFKPLRDYLSVSATPTSSVLTGTVFTIGDIQSPMKKLAAASKAAPVPTASGWVKCGSGTSPCPDVTGTRACGSGTVDYDEYHALVSIPIFQKGTAPYLASGGDIDSSKVARTEDVCVALTVPKKTVPAAGFPVAVFAHGTGGSFRDHVRDEVAGALARATPPIAVLGYDQVQHGPRRNGSTLSPNVLFFNFKNPAAARGNPLQGAADVISMGRFVKTFGIAAVTPPLPDAGASDAGGSDGGMDASPPAVDSGTTPPQGGKGGPAGVKFDVNHLVFFGHSQGAMHGSLGLPFSDDFRAAVLSGNGASLKDALTTKTRPENIAAAVPIALGGDFDGSHQLFGGGDHPVLSILQQWIDPADPLNFATAIAKAPTPGVRSKSVFQTYGLGDTYSPPVTLETYAVTAGLTVAAHDPSVSKPDDIGAEEPVPLSGNFETNLTLAVREYQPPDGKDGHFVVFDVPSANQDAVRFLAGAAAGKVPVVGK